MRWPPRANSCCWATGRRPATSKQFRAATRSSDLMLSHLRAFADASGEQRWLTVRDRGYGLIDTITGKVQPQDRPDAGLHRRSRQGAEAGSGKLHGGRERRRISRGTRPAIPGGSGSTICCMARRGPQGGARRAQQMGAHKVKDRPEAVADTYRLDGRRPGRRHRRAHLRGADGRGRDDRSRHQAWLNAVWDHVVAQKLEDDDFYGNTLKLMAMIAMSGHWTKP